MNSEIKKKEMTQLSVRVPKELKNQFKNKCDDLNLEQSFVVNELMKLFIEKDVKSQLVLS